MEEQTEVRVPTSEMHDKDWKRLYMRRSDLARREGGMRVNIDLTWRTQNTPEYGRHMPSQSRHQENEMKLPFRLIVTEWDKV